MHNNTLNTVLARLLRITTPKRHQKDISAHIVFQDNIVCVAEFDFTTTLQHKKFAAPALHPSLLTPVYSALSARRDIEHKAEFNIRHIVRAFPGWHINLKLSSSKTSSNIANFSYYQTEANLSTSYYF